MRSKLRFHKQETPDSCVPACLRMVLTAMGLEISEAELRERCDCTMFGTDAFMAVGALRGLGFERSRKETGSMAGLIMELSAGGFPIVFINLLRGTRKNFKHLKVPLFKGDLGGSSVTL